MQINKSQLAREFGLDRRMINKYLNGYVISNKRNKGSKIDEFHDVITSLLSKNTFSNSIINVSYGSI